MFFCLFVFCLFVVKFPCYWWHSFTKSIIRSTLASLCSSKIDTSHFWIVYTASCCTTGFTQKSIHGNHCDTSHPISLCVCVSRVCVCVCYTLSLEGVEVMSEGVCWFTLLQDTQVSKFLHLCFLCFPLPHCDHHLITTQEMKS